MIAFLTSSLRLPIVPGVYVLNPVNYFLAELRRCLPKRDLRVLYVASAPDTCGITEFYGRGTQKELLKAGFQLADFTILDGRNAGRTRQLTESADFIILAGGHVPTQNAFFRDIGLKACLEHYDGVVAGLSAGSMNAARTVYAQPELEGEAADPAYEKYLPGLGLTEVNILPHYQLYRHHVLDGLRVFEDVTYPDSMGKTFYALPDGSYLYCENGREELRGEAYCIRDGVCRKVCESNQRLVLR